ncbi:MAG: hypothetical protein FRX49_07626 [Trebouxia sp. A1-2]|nr:MAG: hypothetical protein FRX49_07626 [Trebouxia sp. A1-2]
MGQRDLARAALATTLAVAFAACPSTAQTIYNDTVVQFAAAEANGPANPSCGFGPLSLSSFPFGKAASINANSPFLEGLPQGGCGLCFQLTCEAGAICENSNQPLVVQLVDSGTSNISIRAQDFTALAPAYLGSIPVSVQQANCSIAGNIVIRILQYRAAGGGYIQLTFLNTIGGIDSVLLSASQANNFQPMYNQMAAVWVASNLPTPPLDVRIVSVTGQSVTAVGAITSIAQADIPTSVQFDATSQSSSASPAASGGVAVYTFPPSLPEATPTLPESPALTPPEPHATDGPPPSSPLPPLLNNTSPSPDSPTPSQAPAQETPTAAVVSAAAVAAAPSPGLAETLPAPTSFSEPAVAPSFSAVPAAPAPSKLLAAAPAASASSAAPTEPAASTATPLTNLAAAQLSVPAPTLIPGNSTITSSLESSSTADASLSLSSVTAAAQNLSAEPLAAGLVDAFNSSMQELTMFAPLNSAFQSLTVEVENALANLDGTLTTASQYLGSQPSLAQAIIGYQTVQSSHPLSLLRTQTQLNTSDILGANNASSYSLPLTIVVAGGNTAKKSRQGSRNDGHSHDEQQKTRYDHRALTIYPKGRKADPHEADLFLACIGTKPEDAIKFQLWVHNHPSVQKSIKSDGSRFFKGNSHGFGFMSPENLFRPENGFMQGQKLAVGVHISAIEPGSKEQQPVQESPSLFGPFFDNCSTSDIVIKAGEATIHAHKIVLSVHSSLFRAMFQVDKLWWLCLQQIIHGVNKKTILEYAVVADAVTDTELMDVCMKFLLESKNSYEIAEQPAMQELILKNPSLAQKLLVENALVNPDGSLETASQYLGSQPSLAQAIIGYQTVQGSHLLSLLRTQTQLNTSDSLVANNASSYSLPLTVIVAEGNTAKNSANVLQTDIPACGPSLLQLTDAVLLPVNPTDYVKFHITPSNGSFTLATVVAG